MCRGWVVFSTWSPPHRSSHAWQSSRNFPLLSAAGPKLRSFRTFRCWTLTAVLHRILTHSPPTPPLSIYPATHGEQQTPLRQEIYSVASAWLCGATSDVLGTQENLVQQTITTRGSQESSTLPNWQLEARWDTRGYLILNRCPYLGI